MSFSFKPVIVDDVEVFRRLYPHVEVIDALPSQHHELARIASGDASSTKLPSDASYYYYPWRNVVVPLLARPEFEELCGARNRTLFSDVELGKLRLSRVGIAGMSVGSRVLEPLAHGPALGELRLIDPDVVTATSLNRMPASVTDINIPKVIVAARLATEVRPWSNVRPVVEPLSDDNLDDFLDGLDIVVCAMDDPRMKLRLRDKAASKGINVIMGTDIETGLIDFEPYRECPSYRPFHGALDDQTMAILRSNNELGREVLAAIAQIVGVQNLSAEGLMMALALMKGELPSMSQLATTTTAVGAAVARMIHLSLSGRAVRTGRIDLRLDPNLLEAYDGERARTQRSLLLEQVAALFAPAPKTGVAV